MPRRQRKLRPSARMRWRLQPPPRCRYHGELWHTDALRALLAVIPCGNQHDEQTHAQHHRQHAQHVGRRASGSFIGQLGKFAFLCPVGQTATVLAQEAVQQADSARVSALH